MTRTKETDKARKTGVTTQSLSSFVKGICDMTRRSNCASALQYVPELTWILFLRILDAQEARDQENAEVMGTRFTFSSGCPPGPPASYRANRPLPGWDFHPQGYRTPSGRTEGTKDTVRIVVQNLNRPKWPWHAGDVRRHRTLWRGRTP